MPFLDENPDFKLKTLQMQGGQRIIIKEKRGLSGAKEPKTDSQHPFFFDLNFQTSSEQGFFSNSLCISKWFLHEKGPFSGLYLWRIKRLWSMKPIQNIRFEEWPKVGLCTMSSRREIMMSSIKSPFPCIFCSGVSNGCCGSQRTILVLSNQVEIMAKSPGQETESDFGRLDTSS